MEKAPDAGDVSDLLEYLIVNWQVGVEIGRGHIAADVLEDVDRGN